jgi:hypothetical protein
VISNNTPADFDPELKKVAITTFLVSLFTGLGLLIEAKLL